MVSRCEITLRNEPKENTSFGAVTSAAVFTQMNVFLQGKKKEYS